MKNVFFLLIILIQAKQGLSQKNKSNEYIGLSLPLVWNNTEIYNVYSGARAADISGSALSYGINVNYSRNIFKKYFIIGGIGYFNQSFGIRRPFDFNGDTITNLLYHTKRYTYSNINLLIGVGYCHALNKKFTIEGSVIFNSMHTFRQKYIPNSFSSYEFKKYQVERKSYLFGQQTNLNIGIHRNVNQKMSFGTDILLPIYTKWRKDRIFRENENEYNHSEFCIGANVSIKYSLH